MKAMPFIDRVHQWAATQPGRAAVVTGTDTLSYAQLGAAAAAAAQGRCSATGGRLAVVDLPTGTALAGQFCAAVAASAVAAVLDSGWPAELRQSITHHARSWAGSADIPASTFLLGLSSGTSGVPKAFMRSRESWRASFLASTQYFGVGQEDVTLAPGPLAASMNLYALGECLFSGSTFVALPGFTPDAALASIRDRAVTRLVLVPTVLGLIAARGLATGQGPSGVTSIVCAGSALPPGLLALARRWAPRARIYQYYGASELGFVAASEILGGRGTGPVGTAFPGVELAVLDAAGRKLPTGEVGDISVRSPYICDGYAWGDDGLALATVNGWHTVRDQGWLDSDGALHVAGRASEMIVTSGANVYPQQVEQALTGDGMEGAVVVTGLADPVRGQRVVAGLLGSPEELAALLAACRKRSAALPSQQRPSRYYALAANPATGAGKVSRALLAEWIVKGDARAHRIQ
ncbi:class I adenylate-forming enzyme family protein [Arthrobacter sp. A2-55]|uniref:class I adenylate-forming enzyme family protein n=1 Tax=Arthrobacter sp. A2-55 TaxID=2897337 RepID=UPI0021CD86E4|nr:AMP-binding protein [Arthrobacter sp. A2-55]MCU6481771.1 AMP-binding protein [Arthrobacter sp. A2-55]